MRFIVLKVRASEKEKSNQAKVVLGSDPNDSIREVKRRNFSDAFRLITPATWSSVELIQRNQMTKTIIGYSAYYPSPFLGNIRTNYYLKYLHNLNF